MQALSLRLQPGDDLRRRLERVLNEHGATAAFVLSGIGSLSVAALRYAGAERPETLRGDTEILSLAGSISVDGAHLHASVSDAAGRVVGGHVAYGCTVRTTVEVLLVLLPGWRFTREPDAATGYAELVPRGPDAESA